MRSQFNATDDREPIEVRNTFNPLSNGLVTRQQAEADGERASFRRRIVFDPHGGLYDHQEVENRDEDQEENRDDEDQEAATGNDEDQEAATGDDEEQESATGDDEEQEAATGNDEDQEAATGNDEDQEAATGDDEEQESATGDDEEQESATGDEEENGDGQEVADQNPSHVRFAVIVLVPFILFLVLLKVIGVFLSRLSE